MASMNNYQAKRETGSGALGAPPGSARSSRSEDDQYFVNTMISRGRRGGVVGVAAAIPGDSWRRGLTFNQTHYFYLKRIEQ